MNFANDPCGVGQYITKRLSANDMSSIVGLTRPEVSPSIYGLLQKCQPSTAAIERSFSMLQKLLAKDRNFKPHNVRQFLVLYYNGK